MWFFKKKEPGNWDLKTRQEFFAEITHLFSEIDKLNSKIGNIEIDMRFLQDKIKNKIFRKEEIKEMDETHKKPGVFLNPYGNPI